MKDFSYNQLIELDMECGGLTKRQAVLYRTKDRRWKKAHRNIIKNRTAKCRIERYIVRELGTDFDEFMGG